MEQTLARPLTRAQQARRQRVIDAAMALGLEGGYEAVQMRDVAARADVAMGTVYRYFTSKDHLLAATLVHWVEMLDTRIGQHPPRGAHPAVRCRHGGLARVRAERDDGGVGPRRLPGHGRQA